MAGDAIELRAGKSQTPCGNFPMQSFKLSDFKIALYVCMHAAAIPPWHALASALREPRLRRSHPMLANFSHHALMQTHFVQLLQLGEPP